MKKYFLAVIIVLIAILIVLFLIEKVKQQKNLSYTDLYDHVLPACISTNGVIGKPKRAINTWPGVYEGDVYTAFTDLQVDWIRSDFLWEIIEPTRGEYNWENYDFTVRELRNRNIQILGMLNYSPPWANGNRAIHYPPTNLEDYSNYIREVVERYKPNGVFAKEEGWTDGYGVTHWQIWNEPNGRWFWLPFPNTADYVEMLHQANKTIRNIDEKAVILLGGLDPGGLGDNPTKREDATRFSLAGFMEDVYKAGAKNCFDVVSVHPYLFSDISPTEIKNIHIKPVRTVMAKYNDFNKPIWATEFGYTSGKNGWVTEERQAELLKEAYKELEKGSFQALFWFSIGEGNGERDNFGLLREDFSKKPAYQIYRDEIISQ